jgi:mono/diheme cytochrome c family protein
MNRVGQTGIMTIFAVLAIFALISIPLSLRAQTDKEKAPQLSEEESKGEEIFLQRCSLCHVRKVVKPYKSYGPSLKGVLAKDADEDQESFVRQFIQNGTDKMPGFKYGLTPNQIAAVMAYLKTL